MPNHYLPTLHQFQQEIEDGYRRDGSTVRIGYKDEDFPGYSWRGYGSYSQLQDEVSKLDNVVINFDSPLYFPINIIIYINCINMYPLQVLLDVSITNPSTYQMIIRYTNPNPTPLKGEVSMEAPANVDSGDALTVTHHVVLPPTG